MKRILFCCLVGGICFHSLQAMHRKSEYRKTEVDNEISKLQNELAALNMRIDDLSQTISSHKTILDIIARELPTTENKKQRTRLKMYINFGESELKDLSKRRQEIQVQLKRLKQKRHKSCHSSFRPAPIHQHVRTISAFELPKFDYVPDDLTPSAPLLDYDDESEITFEPEISFNPPFGPPEKESKKPDDHYSSQHQKRCATCLQELDFFLREYVGILSCRHVFCKPCIERIQKNCKVCPYCRKQIEKNKTTYPFSVVVQQNPPKFYRAIPIELSKKTIDNLLDLPRDERRKIILGEVEQALKDDQKNMYCYIEFVPVEQQYALPKWVEEKIATLREQKAEIVKELADARCGYNIMLDYVYSAVEDQEIAQVFNITGTLEDRSAYLKNTFKANYLDQDRDKIKKLERQKKALEEKIAWFKKTYAKK